MYYDEEVPATRGCLRVTLLTIVALIVLGLTLYFGLSRIAGTLNPFADLSIKNPFEPVPTEISVDRPAVVRQIRSLNRLETATAAIEKVITAGQSGSTLYNLLRGDRLILIAHGEVIAGFDLSKLSTDDIIISEDGTFASVMLPPAEILVSRLDNERTQVYDRKVGILTRGDPGLESEARRVAEQQILLSACESGLLARAVEDGKRNIENLVKSFGIDEVVVNASAGPCVAPSIATQTAVPSQTP
jgi:hypothetical protein